MRHYEARRLMSSSASLLLSFKRAAFNRGMATVAETRLANLERLIVEFGTLEKVAGLAGSTSIYLSQIRNRAKDAKTGRPREMGSAIARRLEAGTKKPAGWMDVDHSFEGPPLMNVVSGGQIDDSNVNEVVTEGRVPVISLVRAGEWCEAHDPWQPGDADEWLPCPVRHSDSTFALRVVGDSMDGPGGYREGEVIFVDPGVAPTPGKDVIARTPNGKVTFKRLKEDDQGQYLLALNPNWPDRIIRVPAGTQICGVVIGSFMPR